MCNLQSDGKRNSLGTAQLDKLLSVLLFVLCQKALHLYPQGLRPVTTLGVVGHKASHAWPAACMTSALE